MKRILLIFSFILFSNCFALADEIDSVRILASEIKTKTKGKIYISEYCPDSTCEGVRVLNGKKEDSKKYLLLYLLAESGYIYLKNVQSDQNSQSELMQLIEVIRHKKCKSDKAQTQAICILKNLIAEKKIELYSIRFDEQRRIETKIKM